MRVRITRARQGEIDGVVLDAFQVGEIYDVPASLGTYLVITSSAELVEDTEARPLSAEIRFDVSSDVRAVAAERARARRERLDKKK